MTPLRKYNHPGLGEIGRMLSGSDMLVLSLRRIRPGVIGIAGPKTAREILEQMNGACYPRLPTQLSNFAPE